MVTARTSRLFCILYLWFYMILNVNIYFLEQR
jgi:hypothetical protein